MRRIRHAGLWVLVGIIAVGLSTGALGDETGTYAPSEPGLTAGGPTTTGGESALGGSREGVDEKGMWLVEQLAGITFYPQYRGTYYFEEGTDQMGRDIEWFEHRFSFAVPVYRRDGCDVVVYTKLKMLDFNDHGLRFPMSGAKFPNDLYDLRFGAFARKTLSGGRTLAGRLEIGSPSDEPFSSWDEISIRADVLYHTPWRERMSWVFFLSFSNTRDAASGIPIPGAGLLWEPNDRLTVLAGIPVMAVDWRPTERWRVQGSYVIPRTVHAQVGYQLCERAELYGAFDWDSQRYFRHNRADDDDMMQYYEKRFTLGLKLDVTQNCYVDLGGGYAFGRFWFEDDDYGDRRDTRIDLDSGLFAFLQVGIRF